MTRPNELIKPLYLTDLGRYGKFITVELEEDQTDESIKQFLGLNINFLDKVFKITSVEFYHGHQSLIKGHQVAFQVKELS